jgi:hypothetical protein
LNETLQKSDESGKKPGKDPEKQRQQKEELRGVLNQGLKFGIYLSTSACSPRRMPALLPKRNNVSKYRLMATRTPRRYVGTIRWDRINAFCRQNNEGM